jgi:hypothetical protein
MSISFTAQVVLYLIAVVFFIAAAIYKPRSGEALAVGLAIFALAHIFH